MSKELEFTFSILSEDLFNVKRLAEQVGLKVQEYSQEISDCDRLITVIGPGTTAFVNFGIELGKHKIRIC